MALFTSQADALLLIFISAAICKYVLSKEEERNSIKWVVMGGFFFLIEIVYITVGWTIIGVAINSLLSFVLRLVGLIFVLVGVAKLIFDMFS